MQARRPPGGIARLPFGEGAAADDRGPFGRIERQFFAGLSLFRLEFNFAFDVHLPSTRCSCLCLCLPAEPITAGLTGRYQRRNSGITAAKQQHHCRNAAILLGFIPNVCQEIPPYSECQPADMGPYM